MAYLCGFLFSWLPRIARDFTFYGVAVASVASSALALPRLFEPGSRNTSIVPSVNERTPRSLRRRATAGVGHVEVKRSTTRSENHEAPGAEWVIDGARTCDSRSTIQCDSLQSALVSPVIWLIYRFSAFSRSTFVRCILACTSLVAVTALRLVPRVGPNREL